MPRARNYRCLLVEDVEAMRAFLCIVLEGIECEVVAAESLTAARQILSSQAQDSFDFVILDLQLPDGNGLELLPEVDESIRVIALTADDSREARLQCRHAGCDVVLSKCDELAKLKDILTGPSVAAVGQQRSVPETSYAYICYLAETRLELEKVRRKSDLLKLRKIAHRRKLLSAKICCSQHADTALYVMIARRVVQLNRGVKRFQAIPMAYHGPRV
jgi:CheY-like chemotaxis protein